MNSIDTEEDIRRLEMMVGGPAAFHGTHVRVMHSGSREPDMILESRVIGPDGKITIEGPPQHTDGQDEEKKQ